jgi:hypothetical protein
MIAIHIHTIELTTVSKCLFRPNGAEQNHLQNVHTDKTCFFAAGLRKGCKAFVTDRSQSCFTHACALSRMLRKRRSLQFLWCSNA